MRATIERMIVAWPASPPCLRFSSQSDHWSTLIGSGCSAAIVLLAGSSRAVAGPAVI
jgi:hypothetical protein